MEVTRFDAGTARLVLDDVDIADQITACIDARAWLDAVDLDAERGIMARLDPRRLDVILANLIGNALKHGGSPVRVWSAWRPTTFSSRSRTTGLGIPEDVLPHVFDRFYKASASRPRSRAAVWPSIALENAHIHGGEITAANTPRAPSSRSASPRTRRSCSPTTSASADGTGTVRRAAPDDDLGTRPRRAPTDASRPPPPSLPLLAVLLAGCGIRSTQVPTDFGPAPSRVPCALSGQDITTQSSHGIPVQVFLICSGQLVTVDRSVRIPDGTAEGVRRVLGGAGSDELAETPSTPEQQAGYTTDVRGGMTVSGPRPQHPRTRSASAPLLRT